MCKLKPLATFTAHVGIDHNSPSFVTLKVSDGCSKLMQWHEWTEVCLVTLIHSH